VIEEKSEEPPPQPIVENAIDTFSSRMEVLGPEVMGARKRRNPLASLGLRMSILLKNRIVFTMNKR
jgi:hypothetical protein